MPETPTHRKQKFLGRLAYWIYRIYSATFRYRLYSEDPAALEHSLAKLNRLTPEPGQSFICAFWHQDELPLPFSRIDIVIGRPDIYTRDETDHVLNSLTAP